jgi:hypothetical protein
MLADMSGGKVNRNRRQGLLESTNTSGATGRPDSSPDPDRPEWATERWKVQVEAEARSRLKRLIRDLGSAG